MTITVIGHPCLDVIHHTDGSKTESYGGIFYSVATIANLVSQQDVVLPVFGIGANEYDAFIKRLSKYPNINTKGIFKFDGPTNIVNLFYDKSGNRIECSEHIAEPIAYKKIRPYLDCDMVLINMVSGFDITLETLDEIRIDVREQHTPIYLDVHSLTLGSDSDAKRYRKPVEMWRRWLFMLHAVQMNEEEAKGLTPEHLNEDELAKHSLALMTKAVIITRGSKGYTMWIEDHKNICRIEGKAHKEQETVDPTGCGDVFAATYCVYYLKTKNIIKAAEYANRVAGWKAAQRGSLQIDALSTFSSRIPVLEEKL